ncbi:homeobox protein knotted-1-like protein 2 [Tanacetum coccineum]
MCFKEDVGNVPVWVKLHGVLMTKFSEDGLSAIATKLGTPLMLDSYTFEMCMKSRGRSSYARAMIKLRGDVELKDTIVVAMPKLVNEGFYSVLLVSNMSGNLLPVFELQATRGVLVGPKVSFKSTKKIYKPVSNKNGASNSGKKKQAELSRQEVGNSNPFDALNSIKNDDDLDKIDKLECHIIDGKLMFVNDDENPLAPMGNVDSESEVEVVFDETANLMASTSFKGGSDRS